MPTGPFTPRNGYRAMHRFQPPIGMQHFAAERREPLADRGRLRRHVVRPPGQHQRAVLRHPVGQARQAAGVLLAQEPQRAQDLHLLDVLGQIAARQALMDVLVPSQRAELVDARP